MTAQIGDRLDIDGLTHSILMRIPLPFAPASQGLRPRMASTACYNGYFCHYLMEEDTLYLNDFYVYTGEEEYPPLFGRSPERNRHTGKIEHSMGCAIYRNLHLRSHYTGRLLVGRDFIHDFYIHAGLQRPHSFIYFYEYEMRDGCIVGMIDRSEEAAAERARIREERERLYREWEAAHRTRPPFKHKRHEDTD